jgi:cytochrome c peroxidase
MSLVNDAYRSVLTWSNPAVHSLEEQARIPMFSKTPLELGLSQDGGRFIQTLRVDPFYRIQFPAVFSGTKDPFTIRNVAKAIAAFERTIISIGAPYDRYRYQGDESALSDSAQRGELLFFTDEGGAGCFRCHSGIDFADDSFHNTGLYNLPGLVSYPPESPGIFENTRRMADVGRFKTPTLRNIALTAPYMHDGSAGTLEAVLDHYAAGGRTGNPHKDQRLRPRVLTDQNRKDLIAFLTSLTDDELIHDPRFADPWPGYKSSAKRSGR